MFKIALFITLLLLGLTISCQNSFELQIQMPNYEVPGDLIIDDQGSYVIAGASLDVNTNVHSGFLLKVSASGEIVTNVTYSLPDSTCLFSDIIKLESNYLVFGGIGPISSGLSSIMICSFDFDLTFQWQKQYLISNIHTIGDCEAKVDLDGNIVIIGSAYKDVKNLDDDPFEFRCNQQGDSILMVVETLDYHQMVFDFLIKPDSSGYIAFGSGQYPQYPYIDANGAYYGRTFNREQVREVPNEIYWSHTVKWINDYEFFISGNKNLHTYPTIQGVGLMRLDTSFSMLDDVHFGLFPDTACYPGWDRSFDYIDIDDVFFTGTKNYEHWFQNMPSWIMLLKFDSCLNTVYEQYYGGDALYSSYQINATDDGGCIISGIRYDYNLPGYNYDLYLIKTDENGLVTSIEGGKELSFDKINLYPNPGTNHLKVRVSAPYKHSIFELYDIDGRIMLTEAINGKWGEVNTAYLKSGTYIYKLYNEEGLFESGKWLKR